jgi:dTMP kinase
MGKWIVFEGGEGCGKTTQIELLSKTLRERGKNVVCTREPGGTPFAEDLRSCFKKVAAHGDEPTPLCELYLVLAARAQHVQKKIVPLLAEPNTVVLCDRFLDSTYVYQGVLGGVKKSLIDSVALPIIGSLVPHLTFVLNCSAQVSWKRIQARKELGKAESKNEIDRLDESHFSTFETLSNGYCKLVNEKWTYPNGLLPLRHEIDASESIAAMQAKIEKFTIDFLVQND